MCTNWYKPKIGSDLLVQNEQNMQKKKVLLIKYFEMSCHFETILSHTYTKLYANHNSVTTITPFQHHTTYKITSKWQNKILVSYEIKKITSS